MRSVELWLPMALLGGCAWPLANQQVTAQMSREVAVAAARAADAEAALAKTDARLAALEESVRQQGLSQSEKLETIDQVNAEIARLRGEVEKIRFELDEVKRQADQGALDRERRMLHSERRLSAIEAMLRIKPPPPPSDAELTGQPLATDPTGGNGGSGGAGGTGAAGTGGAGGAEPVTPPPPTDPEAALDLAADHMKEGRPAVARAILEKAAEDFPNASQMAEIKYRIAETWYLEKQWGKAIQAFDKVVQTYPKSDWAAWSLLYQGDAFVAKGQREDAKLFFEECVTRFPKSDAAKEAKKRLAK